MSQTPQTPQKKVFSAKVLTIGENVLENSNGTQYVIGTIEHPVTKHPIGARIYMNNLVRDGKAAIEAGLSYLCTAQTYVDAAGNTQVDITVSHLTTAPRAQVADFDSLPGEVMEVVPANTATVSKVS